LLCLIQQELLFFTRHALQGLLRLTLQEFFHLTVLEFPCWMHQELLCLKQNNLSYLQQHKLKQQHLCCHVGNDLQFAKHTLKLSGLLIPSGNANVPNTNLSIASVHVNNAKNWLEHVWLCSLVTVFFLIAIQIFYIKGQCCNPLELTVLRNNRRMVLSDTSFYDKGTQYINFTTQSLIHSVDVATDESSCRLVTSVAKSLQFSRSSLQELVITRSSALDFNVHSDVSRPAVKDSNPHGSHPGNQQQQKYSPALKLMDQLQVQLDSKQLPILNLQGVKLEWITYHL